MKNFFSKIKQAFHAGGKGFKDTWYLICALYDRLGENS